ncbi:helix-turn-helix transcriptional regulator [Brevibacillus agri]|uniref:helix-turn-helix transcriptional regulator n=1 Tax=Brevibacillus agri TaxID=51101 RepID=UPI002E1E066F|nr:helix-turn-helix transcriptional regulator [Brevibacillus agri]
MKKRSVLISLRKQRNWSQKDVVERLSASYGLHITISYYGMIEQGVRTPKLELALAISSLFERSPDEIFFEQINNKTLGKSTA